VRRLGPLGIIRVWEPELGREVSRLAPLAGGGSNIDFSPDGTRLAAAYGLSVRLWDLGNGEEIDYISGTGGEVAWCPDGPRVAITSNGTGPVRIWDADARREVQVLDGAKDPVTTVAWSPDGKRLAAAGVDPNIRVWDVSTGQELLRLPGHQGRVMKVAWSPDGKRLGSVGLDGTIRVWGAAPRAAWLPSKAEAHNNLAWFLAADPGRRPYDPARAVALATQAVAEGGAGTYWNTLGVAHYRAGDWKEAAAALEKSQRLQGENGYDSFFLAMTYARQGRRSERATASHGASPG